MRKLKVTNVRIQQLQAEKKEAEKNVWRLHALIESEQAMCEHKYVPDELYDPSDTWFSASGFCEKCGDGCGWWCPKSPNGACDYEQSDGTIDEDSCIYCHNPDERK